jgi:uncharacterized repeat protein (TIGR03833 family)
MTRNEGNAVDGPFSATCQWAIRMDARKRADIKTGARVQVVQKQDQRSGRLTEGTVQEILTNSATHPHGIKVRLTNGVVGRVKVIIPEG